MRRCAPLVVVVLSLAFAHSAAGFVYYDSLGQDSHTTIGRASLGGGGAQTAFISGASIPCGLAVDASHLYWGNSYESSGFTSIGRSNIDGSGVRQVFISGARSPCGVAVDATHVYWANTDGPAECTSHCTSIGRANLDGTGANQVFISGLTEPRSLAVDGAHIYWGSWGHSAIGRANLDGGAADEDFIPITPAHSLFDPPCAVAVDGAHVYWNFQSNTQQIGRANLDGTQAEGYIATSGGCGVAVDALQPTATTIAPSVPGPTLFGQDVTYTATVASAEPDANASTPTGMVQFQLDGVDDGPPVALSAGKADYGGMPDVDSTLTARYSGGATFGASSGQLSPDVRPAPTVTTLTQSPGTAAAHERVTFIATVRNTSTDFTPFGSVQFLVDGDPVLGPLELDFDGQAAIVTDGLDPGSYEIRALYQDDTAVIADFGDSEASLTARFAVRPPPPIVPPPPPPPAPTPNNAFKLLKTTVTTAGTIRLRVSAPDPGRFTASARRRTGTSRPKPYPGAHATLKSAGTLTLVLRPSARTKLALKHGTTQRLSVAVTFTSSRGGAARIRRALVTVKGRFRAARQKR